MQEPQFNEELLTGGQEIREHIIEEMIERELSKGWAKDRLDKARLFCEYLVKNAYLGVLLRAIDRHWSRIGKGFSIVIPPAYEPGAIDQRWDSVEHESAVASAFDLEPVVRRGLTHPEFCERPSIAVVHPSARA